MECYNDEHTFETFYEAESWAESIANEMSAGAYWTYTTSDKKVAYVLTFRLATIIDFKVSAQEGILENGKIVTKIWITRQ